MHRTLEWEEPQARGSCCPSSEYLWLGRGCKYREGRANWAERTNSLDLSDTWGQKVSGSWRRQLSRLEAQDPPPTSFTQTSRWQVSAVTKSHLCSVEHPFHSLTSYFIKSPTSESERDADCSQSGSPINIASTLYSSLYVKFVNDISFYLFSKFVYVFSGISSSLYFPLLFTFPNLYCSKQTIDHRFSYSILLSQVILHCILL